MASDDIRERVLRESRELFERFGFARTTFTEIAQAAGVSRPTLYALFRDKAEIAAAVLERVTSEAIDEIHRRTANKRTLGERLRTGLMVRREIAIEDDGCFAKEILEMNEPSVRHALEEANARREKALVRLIRESSVDLKPLRLTAPKLARLLSTSMRGFIQHADNEPEVRELANALVRLIERATR